MMIDMDRKTVLVVDDVPENIDILKGILAPFYAVKAATNGADALTIVEKSQPDLILLDIMMPGMDGFEVCGRIKEEERSRSIPIIFVTARSAREDVARGLALGAYYYLTKPADPPVLLSVVEAALAERAALEELRREVRRAGDSLALLEEGRFSFRTLAEGRDLATLIAKACPDPEACVMGLTEMMVNAVEHGNLGITYQDKSRLNAEGRWEAEVIRRLADPKYVEKRVDVILKRTSDSITIRIRDEGAGFDWRPFVTFDPKRAFDTHGRGIAMAHLGGFDQVAYQGRGEEVLLIVLLKEK